MLPLLLSVAIAQVHKPTAVDIEFQHIEQARQELSKGGLSSKTRLMLEQDASSSRPDFSLAAISKLEWAVQMSRYPKAKLLKTIERRADTAPHWWGVDFALEYGRTLGLKLTGHSQFDGAAGALLERHEPALMFSHEDRAFILTRMKSNTISGRLDALYAILPKKHLSNSDAAWVRGQLSQEAAKREGPERQFWQFAQGVCRYRGAA